MRTTRLARIAVVGAFALATVPAFAAAAAAATPADTTTTLGCSSANITSVPDPAEPDKLADVTANDCDLTAGPAPAVQHSAIIQNGYGYEADCGNITSVAQNADGTYNVTGQCTEQRH